MRAENRHYTKVWKKRRREKHGDRCGNPKCGVCHSNKVAGVPTRQEKRMEATTIEEGIQEHEERYHEDEEQEDMWLRLFEAAA